MANFTSALLVDGTGVGLAAFGFLHPVVAALIHVASELLFLLDSARLLVGRGLERLTRGGPTGAST